MVNRAVKRCRELLAATALPQEFAERGMGLHPCRIRRADLVERREPAVDLSGLAPGDRFAQRDRGIVGRGCSSEEHTSELQSLMCISYAVFCWKKNKKLSMTQFDVGQKVL